MTTPAEVWESFAVNAKPRRAVNAAGASTWLNWTQYPDHGPDEAVIGPVHGKHILELGCGTGANLAHLATLGAHCTGVDIAPSRTAAAVKRWGTLPNIQFATADALDHLTAPVGAYDIVYSIFGAVWFTDPHRLLHLTRDALSPGGVLAFSHLPPSEAPQRPDRLITKYELSIEQWQLLLDAAGFTDVTGEIIAAPDTGKPGTLLVRAQHG